jgi:hypothetical protein
VFLFAACGGESKGEPMTLQAYFEEVQQADSIASGRFQRIRSQLDGATNEAEGLSQLKQVFPQQVATLEDLVEALEALRPPAEVESVHEAALAALKDSAEITRSNSDKIERMTSLDDATEILSSTETLKADEATANTCLALERAGTERGITVDLDC